MTDTMVIFGWALAAIGAFGVVAWLFYEAIVAPTVEDEEPIVYGPRAVAVRKQMRADLISELGIQDEVPS